MNMTHMFLYGRFLSDLEIYLKKSSLRKFSDETNQILSYSKVQRLVKGQAVPSAIDLVICCSVMKKSPCDYFDRVLL